MSRTITTIAILCLLTLRGYTAEPTDSSRLYAIRLQSVTVPTHFQEKCSKELGAKLSSTYIYVTLVCDGKPVWISPKQKLIKNQTRFEWRDTPNSVAALLWERGDDLGLRVFLSDDRVEASASASGVGMVGGAGAGALIGGIAAGVFTGGLGAPAGALIGGLIGGGTGAAGGGIVGAVSANDRILFEVACSHSDAFPLNGVLEHTKEYIGEKYTASVCFDLLETKAATKQGELKLGEKYIVRMRTINLSEAAARKGEKKTENATYYIVLRQGDKKYSFMKDEPFSLPTEIDFDPSIITVLKNTGEATQIRIYEQDRLRDDLVFTSTIGKIDGKSWAFIGRNSADDVNDTSYVVFETFGPLK